HIGPRVGVALEVMETDTVTARANQRIEAAERLGGDVLEDEQSRHRSISERGDDRTAIRCGLTVRAHDTALAVITQLLQHVLANESAADDDAPAAVIAAPPLEQQIVQFLQGAGDGLTAVRDVARKD